MKQALLTTTPLIVCTIIVVLLILEQRQRKEKPLMWLTVWAVAAIMLYGGHFMFFNHATEWMRHADTIYVTANLAVYPLYLIYISELTDQKPLAQQPVMLLLLLAPPVLGGAACGTLYMMMDKTEADTFVRTFLYEGRQDTLAGLPLLQAWLHSACHAVFALQVIGTAADGNRRIKRYHRQLSLLYADTDDKEMHSIGTILRLLVVTSALSVVFNHIGRSIFVDSTWLALPSLAFSVMLFAIGYAGMRQRFSISDITGTSHKEDLIAMQNDAMEKMSSEDKEIYFQLEELMNKKKVYLQHDLQLNETARLLGTNRTYLLRALGNAAGMTFKEYVNRKRIAYAAQLMANNPSLPKIEIATLSGYNSLSAFYRNYKAYKQA